MADGCSVEALYPRVVGFDDLSVGGLAFDSGHTTQLFRWFIDGHPRLLHGFPAQGAGSWQMVSTSGVLRAATACLAATR